MVDGVHAEVDSSSASRRGVSVIVDYHTVNSVSVLVRPVTSISELVAEASIALIGRESRSCLVGDREYTGSRVANDVQSRPLRGNSRTVISSTVALTVEEDD